MAYIIFQTNRIELGIDSVSLGRGQDSDVIINDTTVSRNHAILKKISNKYYIIDSGSSNGTFKDGKRVHSPVMLESKSLIQCGNAQIIFYDNEINEDEDEMTMLSFDSNVIINSIILVADIKGYTTFSEQTDIRSVSKFMSNWFTQTTSCIENNNGYLDSFIGDCIYARWDVDVNNKGLINNILNVAKALNDITSNLTREATNDSMVLSLGVGIHVGDVIVGAVSSNTGLGDAVNTTFRLEGQTRVLNTDIIVSKEAYDMLRINKELFEVQLKGKNYNTTVCAIKYDEISSL